MGKLRITALDRKAARRKARLDKKASRAPVQNRNVTNQSFQTMAPPNSKRKSVAGDSESLGSKRVKRSGDPLVSEQLDFESMTARASDSRTTKHDSETKSQRMASTVKTGKSPKRAAKLVAIDPEDEEIARLEAKLGVNKKGGKERLSRGFHADGFDDEVLEFMKELDSSSIQDSEGEESAADGGDLEPAVDWHNQVSSSDTVALKKSDMYGARTQTGFRLFDSTEDHEEDVRDEVSLSVAEIVNRTGIDTLPRTVGEIASLATSQPRARVLTSLAKTICETVEARDGRNEYGDMLTPLLVALVAGLDGRLGPGSTAACAALLERAAGLGSPGVCGIIGYACSLGMCEASLGLEALELCDDNERRLRLISSGGYVIRKVDPNRYRRVILSIDDDERVKQGHLQCKNHEGEIKRLLKWLQYDRRNNASNTQAPGLLAVTLDDLRQAETRGRWWQQGGAWEQQEDKGIDSAGLKRAIKSPVDLALQRASPALLATATKQGMNTPVKIAVFCVLMSSEDCIDAFDGISRLALNKVDERQVVRVILHCCLSSKVYNPYFALVANRLCEGSQKKSSGFRYQFSFQLALWDEMKRAKSSGENEMRRVNNLGAFMSALLSSSSLSISILKVCDFVRSSPGEKALLETILQLICENPNSSAIHAIFARLDRAPQEVAELVRDGLLVFFKHASERIRSTPQGSKGLSIAKSTLADVRGKAVGAQNEDDDENME